MESLEMVRLGRAAQKPFFRLGCKSMILGGRKPRVLFAQNQMFLAGNPLLLHYNRCMSNTGEAKHQLITLNLFARSQSFLHA